ncbi:MAG TPA: GNAT family N-acetyltransferase, partial [Candidatus Dojkabacteria bacterium]|nr:GNAT family N-acetyltransferase [Candidatus Dojkabacteria bacterium]
MVIIDATLQNFPIFYKLFEELMLEGYETFPGELSRYFLARDYSSINFYSWLERNFRKILLAVEPQQQEAVPFVAKAFLVGDHTYGGVGFISWLGVKKEFRRQGIGSLLLKTYEEYAISKKAHLLELYTSEKNVSFYQRHGFREIGRRNEGYFGQKNIIMDKPLGKFAASLISL